MSRISPMVAGVAAAAMLAAVFSHRAMAQEDDRYFDRADPRLEFEVDGLLSGGAWVDVDGDGDPDLATVDADGLVQLWENGNGELTPTELGDLEGALRVRWLDADGDGDQDLLTVAGDGRQQLLASNVGGFLGDPISYGSTAALSHQAVDVDIDGLLDLFIGAAEGEDEARSGILVRRGDGYARASIEGFLPEDRQSVASLYRAAVDDPLELYSGGMLFPEHHFAFLDSGPRYLGLVADGAGSVQDVVVGDFDGDLVSEMLLVRADPGAAIAMSEDETELTFLLSADNSVASLTVGGPTSLEVEVIDQVGLPTFAIQFGEDRVQGDSYTFTLDGSEGDAANIVRGVDVGLFIDSSDEDDRYRFVLAGTDPTSAQIRVTATTPIEVVQSVGLPREGGALFDLFYELSDDRWTRAQSIPRSTECPAGAAADFDNDGDLDVYLGCSNAIENAANRLFLNDGAGGFRERALDDGALPNMFGVAGVAAADYDSDGAMDLLVMSSGGSGVFSRSAILQGVGNDNHWLGLDLVGTTSPTDPIGATVVVESGGVRQRRDHFGGFRRRAQDDRRLHFGLGDSETVDRLIVRWPSGRVQVIDDVDADRYVTIEEPDRDSEFTDLRVVALDVEPVVRVGDKFTVKTTVENLGNAASQTAEVSFDLPAGWEPRGLRDDISVTDGVVRWTLPSLEPTQSVLLDLAIEIVGASGPQQLTVAASGDFPTNGLTADVVTSTSVDRRFGALWLVMALVIAALVLGSAIWAVTRRR